MMDANERTLDLTRASGGTVYPPYAPYDERRLWQLHYGDRLWERLSVAKGRFDPNGVLTPGPGMFPGTG